MEMPRQTRISRTRALSGVFALGLLGLVSIRSQLLGNGKGIVELALRDKIAMPLLLEVLFLN
jgi:hypothetical protein